MGITLMIQVRILLSDNQPSFSLGCLCDLFNSQKLLESQLQSKFYRLENYSGLMTGVSELSRDDVVIFCTWDRRLQLSVPFMRALRALFRQGCKVLTLGEPVYEQMNDALGALANDSFSQLEKIEPGFGVIEWGVDFVARKTGLEIGEDLMKQFQLDSDRISSLSSKRTAGMDSISSERISDVMSWAEANLDKVQSVELLAEKACLSRRSFDRHFKSKFGCTAKEWLTEKRLQIAKSYLENSDLCMDEVAEISGFGNYPNLRNCFSKTLGQSPNSYRIIRRVS